MKRIRFAGFVIVGLVSVLLVLLPAVEARDVETVVTGHTVTRTDHSIVVVSVDDQFLRSADASIYSWTRLIAGLLLNRPGVVVLDTDVIEAARSRLTAEDVAAIAARFGPGSKTVDELLAPFFRQLGSVVLAYPAGSAGSRAGLPRLDPNLPTATLGDAVALTGFAARPLGTTGSRRLLIPLAAQMVRSTQRRTLLPLAGLATLAELRKTHGSKISLDGNTLIGIFNAGGE